MRRKKEEIIRASREITIVNELGLHARPAAEFVRRANAFRSEIHLVTATGKFSAFSLIDVMRANLERGAVATLEAVGPDAEEAVAKLARVVSELRDHA
ncbi:MAG TPA: HPr family phosphocarrier protein [Chthoniobacterales bacterium]|jgi:phosphotransferase system HPr (HPr) family protein|nr:HPr family phosphocarrier protein [Chthoniobacterales bacterium]